MLLYSVSEERCMECEDDRELNPNSARCKCKDGFTEDPMTFECTKCYFYESKCFVQCPLSTYVEENGFICLER